VEFLPIFHCQYRGILDIAKMDANLAEYGLVLRRALFVVRSFYLLPSLICTSSNLQKSSDGASRMTWISSTYLRVGCASHNLENTSEDHQNRTFSSIRRRLACTSDAKPYGN
jgi:hypothetical protein